MSYDPERHMSTMEQCPELVKRPGSNWYQQCHRPEHHPEPHEAPDDRGRGVPVQWYLPPQHKHRR